MQQEYDIRSKDVLCTVHLAEIISINDVLRKLYHLVQRLFRKTPWAVKVQYLERSNDNHNLRSNNLVVKWSKPKTNATKRSFNHIVAKICNSEERVQN
jgi:hypothetical protein